MDPHSSQMLAQLFCLQGEPIFLAASTHPGEDEPVLEAYELLRSPYPSLLLILAPRHPERAPDLARLIQSHGLAYQLWSRVKSGAEDRSAPVIIIDTIGDLFNLYGVADVAFVGGSLVPHGGQNILEPAAWGRAPIYGPHIYNFRWAQAILEEAGAGVMVHDVPTLVAAARPLLDDPQMRHSLGTQAQAALRRHQGAARRQAEEIVKVFSKGGPGAHGPPPLP
jgi:3-deoxy-D-manno-octulosonic-acid transferase